jgi:hypothetical protein
MFSGRTVGLEVTGETNLRFAKILRVVLKVRRSPKLPSKASGRYCYETLSADAPSFATMSWPLFLAALSTTLFQHHRLIDSD